jgi:hypothetical protein
LDFSAYDECVQESRMREIRTSGFDEGEQRDRRKPPVALYSTGRRSL